MKSLLLLTLFLGPLAQGQTSVQGLSQVRRIFVAHLSGGATSDPFRDMLISALDGTGLFVLTDDQSKADAILKGAAAVQTYTDTLDTDKSESTRTGLGINSGFRLSSGGGGNASSAGSTRDVHRIRERKQDAYASVRLVNTAGDTLWSTTQESHGSKFRSASTDVAAKVARQVTLDMGRLTTLNARR